MHSLLLFAVLVVCCLARYESEVPLFVWSEENFVVSRNEQIRGYFSTEDVGDLIKGFWKSSEEHGLKKFVHQTAEHSLEMVVLFIDSSLNSEELMKFHSSLPSVAAKMEASPSFYVPFATSSKPHVLKAVWKAAHHATEEGANAYVLGPDNFVEQLQENVEEFSRISSLSEIAPAFSNSKIDLLIVYVDDERAEKRLALLDERVKELDELFNTAKFTSYISVLTGVESETVLPTTIEMGVPEEVRRVVMAQEPHAAPNGSYPGPILNGRNTFNVYFNGVFWELFFVLLVLFGLIFFGIQQLLLLQAPDRIPSLAAQKKKKQ